MNQQELSQVSDQELLGRVKKVKSKPITNALLIGFLIGIIIYSIALNSWGFLTIIPLFLVHLLIKNSKKSKELEKLLNERNLKQ